MQLFVRDKSFYKKILTICTPVAAQQIITAGVNMMDTIMLGQLGEVALSASSMATQVHNLFHFMSLGMGMGASVLIARYWGAGDKVGMKKTLALMYRFCLAIALVYTVAVAAAPAGIMQLLAPNEQAVIAEGVRYLLWSLPCFFFHGMSQTTTIVLRNSKQMHIPLYTSIGAFFINIFFNWVFIFGKLGAPAMGVAGAALGTLISRFFEFSMICGYFFLRNKAFVFRVRDILCPCGDLAGEYLRISLPVLISDTLLGLGNSMMAAVGGRIGQVFMSANSITLVTQQAVNVFVTSMGQAAVIITGNTLGERDVEKAHRQGISFVALGFAIGTICGIAMAALGPLMVGAYQITEETRAVATQLMYALGVFVVFFAPESILTKGVLRAGGDTRFLMVLDIVFLWFVGLPLGYLSGVVWKLPPFCTFLFLRIDRIFKVCVGLLRLRSGKWIKKIKTVSETK